MSILFRSIAALAIGASALLTVPADARTAPVVVTADLPTRHVSYADLNLARDEGVRTLEGRVRGAVKNVCSDIGVQPFDLVYGECFRAAWDGARPQISLAIQRATEIATTGHSALPVAAITIVAN